MNQNELLQKQLASYLLGHLRTLRADEKKNITTVTLERAVGYYKNSGLEIEDRKRRFLVVRFLAHMAATRPPSWDFWRDSQAGFVSHVSYLQRAHTREALRHFDGLMIVYEEAIIPQGDRPRDDERRRRISQRHDDTEDSRSVTRQRLTEDSFSDQDESETMSSMDLMLLKLKRRIAPMKIEYCHYCHHFRYLFNICSHSALNCNCRKCY